LAGDVGAFHNFAVPEDVDADGVVAPRDILLVVNELNRAGGASEAAAEGEAVLRFLDVSGDGVISAGDALLAINRLNRGLDTPSGVPLATRLDAAQRSLEAGVLPAISMAEAERVISTLEAGGLPELGERLFGGQIVQLDQLAATLEQVADLVANWSTEAASITDRIADFLDTANTESPLLDQITTLLEDLGVQVEPIRDEIDGIVSAVIGEDGSLGDLLEAWETAHANGETPLLDLLDQLRDTLAENRDAIDAVLDDLRDELQQGELGDRFPRLREILTDGTPIQDLLDEVAALLDDSDQLTQLGSRIDELIERFVDVPFRLGDIFDQILDAARDGARDEAREGIFGDLAGGIFDLFR
jgi:hypothetical protein